MTVLVAVQAQNNEEAPNIEIGKVIFISRDGAMLHIIREGKEFNIIVIIESLDEIRSWEWQPFWIEIYLDGSRRASWGTGLYSGNFVVYSSTHTSAGFDEPGEHILRVELYVREAGQI